MYCERKDGRLQPLRHNLDLVTMYFGIALDQAGMSEYSCFHMMKQIQFI